MAAHLCCRCSMAQESRITGGKVRERERRRGREEERERGEERAREGNRGEGDPHSTPSLPTRTLLYALRDPRGGERSDYRLPPTSSLSLSSASVSLLLSFSLSLASHSFLPPCTRFVPSRSPPPVFDPPPNSATQHQPPLLTTFPSRSHFRFNVGQLSRRAAACANAADKRVFTRCR